jgi:hypothetical protein
MMPLGDERPDPSQTCDRCGPSVRAAYRTRRIGELYLCRHCAYRLWSALSDQGWTIWLLDEDAPTPQAAQNRKTSWWQRS